jgi:hypothetical protein
MPQSPVRSDNSGSSNKIVKRELWWREPPIPERPNVRNQPVDLGKVTSRVDHVNRNYSPPRPSDKRIETKKLEWTNRSGMCLLIIFRAK